MKLYKIRLFFIVIVLFSAEAKAQITEVENVEIFSEALEEEREIWIHLPEDYQVRKQYPVIVVLDAEMYFDLTLQLIENRKKYGKISPSIIVGIPNPNMQERSRNMTFSVSKVDQKGKKTSRYSIENSGRGGDFFNFINNELINVLTKKYSVEIDDFSLIGHSFGGYFTLMQSANSSIFNTIIAIDPSLWYNNGEVEKSLRNSISEIKDRQELKYFIAYQNSAKHNAEKARDLIKFLKENEINVYANEFSNENHGSVFLPALVSVLQELGKNINRVIKRKESKK